MTETEDNFLRYLSRCPRQEFPVRKTAIDELSLYIAYELKPRIIYWIGAEPRNFTVKTREIEIYNLVVVGSTFSSLVEVDESLLAKIYFVTTARIGETDWHVVKDVPEMYRDAFNCISKIEVGDDNSQIHSYKFSWLLARSVD